MSGLEGLYQQIILEHSKARHGDGELPDATSAHHELNPSCGDELTMRVRLDPSHERIEELAWQGEGCSISMASASVLVDSVRGRTVTEAQTLTDAFREMLRSQGRGEPDVEVLGDAVAFHGVSKYVMRVKCAMLAWVALEAAVAKAPPPVE
ncbi:Fe-S cluster assembly sulfur transfer protein SufU [Agromyces aerolatus]|uniref:Fe-S cluster assembly sulfur transfer protein SufU n=1 Tax=Agromyces sp. LY-1074 TaxID=3074080 RepID=UPI0028610459|nr:MULTISPECIES: SUF system NifU family Fe-S cluster assembly protein [unclassified Agromyces]MDR5701534.1 SUF system NifU family Fe-S cluster assembly protein [Agromyces sp. LY-1074]MDR5707859.1 SUF system NifU family Fe-S cluster assembly protein [Agromyces sp. LY-1358]